MAVIETGLGGEFDATNILTRPAVCGISTLGIDHVSVLGDTIEQIAWHKAGIMKPGSPAFSVEQKAPAAEVLRRRAAEKGVNLVTLGIDPRVEALNIKPNTQFQKCNASLAVALAETALKKLPISPSLANESSLPREFVDGLEQTVFRGRCEVKVEDKVTWYIDGAHTADSLTLSSQWFANETAHR